MTDDWVPEFEPVATVDTGSASGGRPAGRTRRLSGRSITAIAVTVFVVAAAAVARAIGGDGGVATPDATIADVPASGPDVVAPPVTLAPVETIPPEWSVVQLGVDSVAAPEVTGGAWVEWSIDLPDEMAVIGRPTDVVVLTADGRLHVIELPSGDVRSTFVAGNASEGRVAVSGDAVAVSRFDGLVVLTTDSIEAPAIEPAEVPRVTGRGDSGEFLVSGGRSSITEPERLWVVGSAGSVDDVTGGLFSEFASWEPRFLASGELVANGPDGVVAVDPDGTSRSIGAGELLGTGPRHVALRRCEPECSYHVVDAATTTASPVPLGELDAYRYWDTSVRISPDGRFVQYADWRRRDPSWRLIDLGTGAAGDLGPLEATRIADAWAPDSSGVFLIDGDRLVFRSVDGPVAAIVGLGAIRSVATRPAAD